jgi:hypothetical protein
MFPHISICFVSSHHHAHRNTGACRTLGRGGPRKRKAGKKENSSSLCLRVEGRRCLGGSRQIHRALREYLYFCTSKASKLRIPEVVAYGQGRAVDLGAQNKFLDLAARQQPGKHVSSQYIMLAASKACQSVSSK